MANSMIKDMADNMANRVISAMANNMAIIINMSDHIVDDVAEGQRHVAWQIV